MTVLKEATNGKDFTGDLTAAIEDDQSFCERSICVSEVLHSGVPFLEKL